MYRCRSCAPWNVRDIRQMKRLTYWMIHKKSVKSLISLFFCVKHIQRDLWWCFWWVNGNLASGSFSVTILFRINRSINQMQFNAMKCGTMRCNANQFMFISLSSSLSRVVFCVGHLRSFNNQSQWTDSPLRVECTIWTNVRIGLSWSESSSVSTIVWFIKWVQWL